MRLDRCALDLIRRETVDSSLRQDPETLDSGGRSIAYSIYNAEAVETWFWFHGTPSCRLEAVFAVDWAKLRGVRLVAIDRPGLGESTPLSARTALSVTEDVLRVADRLKVDRFTVVGGSGGGPYSLACAFAIPNRLEGAVCTAPGGVCANARESAGWIDHVGVFLARHLPAALLAYFRLIQLGARLPPPLLRCAAVGVEAALLHPAIETGLGRRVLDEVFRHGGRGVIDDFVRLGNFGFSLGKISIPTLFVHGERDPFVPARQTKALCTRVPHSRYIEIRGAGHGTAIFALDRIRRELKSLRAEGAAFDRT